MVRAKKPCIKTHTSYPVVINSAIISFQILLSCQQQPRFKADSKAVLESSGPSMSVHLWEGKRTLCEV